MLIPEYKEVHLISRPQGIPTLDNFKVVSSSIESIKDQEILIKNIWMSVDPYMRGRMNDVASYVPPYKVNAVLEGGAIGEVIESKNSEFPIGTKVSHMNGWREYLVSDGKDLTALPKIDVPDQLFLGVLGMPGMTAYTGLFKIAHLKSGDNVFISSASGAVGSIACQIAKLTGCYVAGSVGSEEKANYVKSLGVDAVVNYKTTNNLQQSISEALPNGIDVYYENVGGEHLEAALNLMNPFGRIPVCGMISIYNATSALAGPSNIGMVIINRLKLQGFIVYDHWDQYPDFVKQMGQWIQNGDIKWQETIINGIEKAPDAFLSLFTGAGIGKVLVKLS